MRSIVEGRWVGWPVLVLAVVNIVYASPSLSLERRAANDAPKTAGVATPKSAKPPHKPGEDIGPLPGPVEEMRQAILAAAHSGNIEDLREPLDWNELKPEVSAPAGEDPIAHWKKTSGDAILQSTAWFMIRSLAQSSTWSTDARI